MKNYLLLIPILLFSHFLFAQNYTSSLGVRLGRNGGTDYAIQNAISFNYFFNKKSAGKILFDYSDNPTLGVIFEIHTPIPNTENLNWFYGAGAYIGFNDLKSISDRNLLGAQGIIGLDYKFKNLPINLELDCKPELNIIDNIKLELFNFGFSMRYVFGNK